ncbi:MAG TPA: hypothetical protein VNC16_11650 [Solirubrobacterales bacterium]|jgi:hypothetical protein|nr:hypothetical protein [Solirubrobacterales bacterium]
MSTLRAVDASVSYEELAPRIAALIEQLTPVGAIVCVVSKGDEGLVRFDGRSGWHFPRAASGQYAGHHPIDGSWAVEHLEGLRAAGGAYLVLPSTYYWWFEHYPELERHLRSRYEQLEAPEEVCRIYRLLELPAAAPRVVPDLAQTEQQRRCLPAMRALLDSLLPEEEVVLVLSEGDDSLLDLDRPAWHFPHDGAGQHVPLSADAGRHAVSQLSTLSRNGVRYLLVPVSLLWTLTRRPALTAYLAEECRCLALRERICTIYELRTSHRISNPTSLRPKEAAWK